VEAAFVPSPQKIYVCLSLAILYFVSPILATAQTLRDPCSNGPSQRAWEKDPVHADAVDLGRFLSEHGFVIDCISSSTEQRRFKGEKGAAWFKTNRGIFDVLFLPKGQSFAAFKTVERPQQNGRYLYSFQGTPHILGVEDSSKQMWFIKHDNMLFSVWGDQQLAVALRQAFHER
jgi:hypothetical protein